MTLILDSIAKSSAGNWGVLYETPEARERLLTQFDQGGRSAYSAESSAQWMPFSDIAKPGLSEAFFQKLLEADLIIFAASGEGDFKPEFKSWLDRWAVKRKSREGALAGIFNDRKAMDVSSKKEVYLRHVAHRAGLDYLSRLPSHASRIVPNSLDNFNERAGQMTSVLDHILNTRFPSAPDVELVRWPR
jgi:hypothetical protein